jgi:putative ATP-dependent endonuclease of OLD family
MKDAILKHMKRANRSILQENKIKRSNDVINTNLSDIYGVRLLQQIQLGFVPPDFGDVVDLLRPLLLPSRDSSVLAVFTSEEWNDLLSRCLHGSEILRQKVQAVDGRVFIDLLQVSASDREVIAQNKEAQIYAELEEHLIGVFGLEQNGMGYNNIIYMGTVLGDLQQSKRVETDSYNALLLEEPETHLHPQLLDLVFNFLGRVSKKPEPPPVQLFITSHSPTLTSRAALDSLIMLYEKERTKMALPLSKCPLEPSHKADLQRYLDVTKAQLFFAKGVILVEGISEALLLPLFARQLGRCLDQNAVEVVNVSGTAFTPFARLFNAEHSGKRIEIPCGILTDDDRCSMKDDPYRLTDDDLNISFAGKTQKDAAEMIKKLNSIRSKLQQGEESARAGNVRVLENGNLLVKIAYKTFEYELARIPKNIPPMLDALEKIHPTIVNGLRALFADKSFKPKYKAICVWLAAKDAKAEFAQRLAALLEEVDEETEELKRTFIVPKYIKQVIKHVAPVKTPIPSLKDERIPHETSLR